MELKAELLLFLLLISIAYSVRVKVVPEYSYGHHYSGPRDCEIPCELSPHASSADGEFYIAMNNGDVKNAISSKPVSLIRVIGSQEPAHLYPLLRPEFLRHHFQGMAFLDRESDIAFMIMPDMDKIKAIEMPKHAKPKVTFVAYICDRPNNRDYYVKSIAEVVEVVAPSSCMNNAEWPQCNGKPCTKVETIRDYKIHLAFENGDSPGYVTEKIYQALEAGVLPVYMGTREVAKVVPKGSYIDVAEFESASDLALYLKMVLENETLYNSYFEWKNEPFDEEFEKLNRVVWSEDFFCHLCYFVDAKMRGEEWDHIKLRAKEGTSKNETRPHEATQIPSGKPKIEDPEINMIALHCESSDSSLFYLSVFLNIVLLLFILKRVFKCSAYLFSK